MFFSEGSKPVSRWHLFFYAALASTWFLSAIQGPGNTFLESGWIICRWQSSAKHCLESLKETTCPECASDQSDCDCTSHPWDLLYAQCTLCIPDTCYRRHRWCPFLPGMLAPRKNRLLRPAKQALPREIDKTRGAQRGNTRQGPRLTSWLPDFQYQVGWGTWQGNTDCRFHWWPLFITPTNYALEEERVGKIFSFDFVYRFSASVNGILF